MTWKPATISALSVTDGIAIANNGEDAGFSRPPAPIVYWTGSAQPTNAQQGDVWLYNVQAGEALVYDDQTGLFINSAVASEQALEIGTTEPENTNVLWLDTSEEGVSIPEGGTTGQVLAKASGDDFDLEWSSLDSDDISEGTNNLYFTEQRARRANIDPFFLMGA